MKKVALLFICLNPQYWPYIKQVVEDAREHFLKGHQVDFFLWSDLSEKSLKDFMQSKREPFEITITELEKDFAALLKPFFQFLVDIGRYDLTLTNKVISTMKENGVSVGVDDEGNYTVSVTEPLDYKHAQLLMDSVDTILEGTYGKLFEFIKTVTIYETEPVQWPFPTLMRYHLFTQQEEELQKYDYLFYLDADMRIVDSVGEEIFGEGLTMAEHPMYALSAKFVPPYEPNNQSTAYIHRFGVVLTDETGKPRFKPLYAAGGFQGGKTDAFLEAMAAMKKNIDADFVNNYTAIWNDESHWNKYLSEYRGHLTVLSPSYVYPDSLIQEYYVPVWGRNYTPKIITITKHFTTSKEAGVETKKTLQDLKNL